MKGPVWVPLQPLFDVPPLLQYGHDLCSCFYVRNKRKRAYTLQPCCRHFRTISAIRGRCSDLRLVSTENTGCRVAAPQLRADLLLYFPLCERTEILYFAQVVESSAPSFFFFHHTQ